MADKTATGHIAALVTILIWGTTFISTKVLLGAFTPIEILLIRFLLGYLALWCACPHRLIISPKKREWYFAAAGLCGVALYYLFENIALTYTTASSVGVIISVAPFFTAIFSFLFLRKGRASARFFLGFFLAMAGILIISFGGDGNSAGMHPLGAILAVIAAAVWAAYSILAKKISEFGYTTVQTTRRTFFYGLVFMLPALFAMDFRTIFSRSSNIEAVLNLLFLGLGASALCFVTWNFAVKILGSVKTSAYIYMVPVITAVASAAILREELTPATLLGIVLTLAGLVLSEKKSAKKRIKQ